MCQEGDDCKFAHEAGEIPDPEPEEEPLSAPVVLSVVSPTEDSIPPKLALEDVPVEPPRRKKHASTKSLSISLPGDEVFLGVPVSSEGVTPRPRSMCVTTSSRMDFATVRDSLGVLCIRLTGITP
jgi:hypothetical protein